MVAQISCRTIALRAIGKVMKLNFQYSHHSRTESEDRAVSSNEEVFAAFDDFDWVGESAKATKIGKCSPTLSVISIPNEKMIWFSSYESGSNIHFISQCLFPGEVSAWFGLGKKMGTVSLQVDWFSQNQARKALEFYLAEEFDELRAHYKGA